jgi:hypothetical protein
MLLQPSLKLEEQRVQLRSKSFETRFQTLVTLANRMLQIQSQPHEIVIGERAQGAAITVYQPGGGL